MYGLDLFSLHESAEIVISYLEKVDTQAFQLAKQLYVEPYEILSSSGF